MHEYRMAHHAKENFALISKLATYFLALFAPPIAIIFFRSISDWVPSDKSIYDVAKLNTSTITNHYLQILLSLCIAALSLFAHEAIYVLRPGIRDYILRPTHTRRESAIPCHSASGTISRADENDDLAEISRLGGSFMRWLSQTPEPNHEIVRTADLLERTLGKSALAALVSVFVRDSLHNAIPMSQEECHKALRDAEATDDEMTILEQLPWVQWRYMPEWLLNALAARLAASQLRDISKTIPETSKDETSWLSAAAHELSIVDSWGMGLRRAISIIVIMAATPLALLLIWPALCALEFPPSLTWQAFSAGLSGFVAAILISSMMTYVLPLYTIKGKSIFLAIAASLFLSNFATHKISEYMFTAFNEAHHITNMKFLVNYVVFSLWIQLAISAGIVLRYSTLYSRKVFIPFFLSAAALSLILPFSVVLSGKAHWALFLCPALPVGLLFIFAWLSAGWNATRHFCSSWVGALGVLVGCLTPWLLSETVPYMVAATIGMTVIMMVLWWRHVMVRRAELEDQPLPRRAEDGDEHPQSQIRA
jgi:hypothetical protein